MARRRLERDSARHRQLREWPERLWLQTRREEGRPWLASQRSPSSWCREDDPEELRNALMALESATRFVGSPDPTLPAGRSERQELGEGVKAESRNECRERALGMSGSLAAQSRSRRLRTLGKAMFRLSAAQLPHAATVFLRLQSMLRHWRRWPKRSRQTRGSRQSASALTRLPGSAGCTA